MPKKQPAKPEPPVRTLAELLAESKRLERRGRELIKQAKALACDVAEAKAKGENRRGRRK